MSDRCPKCGCRDVAQVGDYRTWGCGSGDCGEFRQGVECRKRELEQNMDALEDDNARLRSDYEAYRNRCREQAERIATLERACSATNDEVCQRLGLALGYPRFCDDPKNFPDATEDDGVCVGDHVAETLAELAADRIALQDEEIANLIAMMRGCAINAASTPGDFTADCPEMQEALDVPIEDVCGFINDRRRDAECTITRQDEEIERLTKEIKRLQSWYSAFRGIDIPGDTKAMLVRLAFEVGEISHGRCAELLGICVQELRGRGWVQGDGWRHYKRSAARAAGRAATAARLLRYARRLEECVGHAFYAVTPILDKAWEESRAIPHRE